MTIALCEEELLIPGDPRYDGVRRNDPHRSARRHDATALSCLIVDDKDYFLHAVSALLRREGITVTGIASTSAEALRNAAVLRPDVALVDVALGGESGFELARLLTETSAVRPTIILTSTYAEEDIGHLIATSSADAFLPKTELSGDVIRAIHEDRQS
jgi:DNA-binding NarL/FixJ family response regulator